MQKDLNKLFNPKTVAVIGASDKAGSVGSELMLKLTEFGFTGKLYPVNPHLIELCGLKVYKAVGDIRGEVDLAVIAVPAKVVKQVILECVNKKVGSAVIISAGFGETGAEGKAEEREIVKIARAGGLSLLGPNCLGVINTNPKVRLDASFAPLLPAEGSIGFATQSGALASGIVNVLPELNVGLAQLVSLGNQADITALDVISYWDSEPQVKQILLYLENISDAGAFRARVSKVARRKPIIALKSGRTESGAKAAASHTGSLAGSDSAAGALLSSCGVIREESLRNMFISAQCFNKCNLPNGRRVAVITNAGGPGILAADELTRRGLTITQLEDGTKQKLRAFLPSAAAVNNPVDIIASASAEQYSKTVETVLADPNVDMVLVIYLYITGLNDTVILRDLNERRKKTKKPIAAVFMTSGDFEDRLQKLGLKAEIPLFSFVDDAVHGLTRLFERAEFLKTTDESAPVFHISKSKTAKIFEAARKEGIAPTTFQSLEVFKGYGLPVPKFGLARNMSEALEAAFKIGYPVVLKISHKVTSHKSDVGGVVVNIQNDTQLKAEFAALMERLKKADLTAGLEGVVVMQQVKASREFVAGVTRDAAYGHIMMFGIGGIYIEALSEVNFKLLPLSVRDAEGLIDTGKVSKLLGNVRGQLPAKREKLLETLFRLNQLITDFPEIDELDANPLMLDKQGNIHVVDARISLK